MSEEPNIPNIFQSTPPTRLQSNSANSVKKTPLACAWKGPQRSYTPRVLLKAHLRDPNPSCKFRQVETRSVDRLVPADPSNSESCEVPVKTQQLPWLKKS